ncbi:cutinase family protein [Nocardia inohanensis]|uniref:cutinase family protein n=1 Tax=Nocardia inohanensis TaxID=209246 RepID=UPI00082FB7C3|nr:cutinase family protein [Nocardia inohanensis]
MHRKLLSTGAIRNSALITAAVCAVAAVAVGGARGDTPSTQISLDKCPALFAFGVQGTGESSPDAAITTDTGMLSTVFRPMMADATELVSRAYVPYDASFGGAVATGTTPYLQSVTKGVDTLKSMVKQVSERCPSTRIAITGYSQGAHVASLFAQEVGAGKGVVPADKVVAVALFGDPTRNAGAGLFPSSPGKSKPDAAPGTSGTAVAALEDPPQYSMGATGSGMGNDKNAAVSFGSLAGRVASFCSSGDLACDAPSGSPIVRAVANIASQVEISGGDPIASLKSVAEALAYTSIKTFTSVVNNDVKGESIANLSYEPKKSISERIAEASNPQTTVDVGSAFQALIKIGTLALNSVVSVVKSVLTATNIAEIATAGLANPIAGLAVLGTKLVSAVTNLVPPTTVSNLVTQAFTAVSTNITDNKDLLDVTTWSRYWNMAQKHDYTVAPGADFGESATQYAGRWFAAIAQDLSGVAGSGTMPSGGSDKPTGGFDFQGSTTVTTSAMPGFPLGGGATTTGSAPSTPGLFGTTSPSSSGVPLFESSGAPSSGPTGGNPIVPGTQPQVSK